MEDRYNLERFVIAQNADGAYDRALDELGRGHKTSHWMWFVFPQVTGLGQSAMSRRFSISSLDEAKAYLEHRVLGPRILECASIVVSLQGKDAKQIFGSIDAQKLHASMSLFMRAVPADALFAEVIDRYFDGAPDLATEERI